MINHLEATIQKAIADMAGELARSIGHAVRQSLVAEIAGNGAVSASASALAPKKRGRPFGSRNAVTTVTARRRGRRSSIKQAELDSVLNVLRKKPGLTSVQVQQEAGIDNKQAARVFTKLRGMGAVKMKGARSKATYLVA